MKLTLTLLAILSFSHLTLYGQKLYSISGVFLNVESNRPVSQSFQVFRGDTLIHQGEANPKKGFKISGLKEGMYRFVYQNRVYQEFEQEVWVYGANVKGVVLPVERFRYAIRSTTDSSSYQPQPSEQLQVGAKMLYQFSSAGCFHLTWLGIELEKSETGMLVRYLIHNPRTAIPYVDERDSILTHSYILNLDSIVVEKNLTPEEHQGFIYLEQELWKSLELVVSSGKDLSSASISVSRRCFQFKLGDTLVTFDPLFGSPENTFSKWVKEVFERNIWTERF